MIDWKADPNFSCTAVLWNSEIMVILDFTQQLPSVQKVRNQLEILPFLGRDKHLFCSTSSYFSFPSLN